MTPPISSFTKSSGSFGCQDKYYGSGDSFGVCLRLESFLLTWAWAEGRVWKWKTQGEPSVWWTALHLVKHWPVELGI